MSKRETEFKSTACQDQFERFYLFLMARYYAPDLWGNFSSIPDDLRAIMKASCSGRMEKESIDKLRKAFRSLIGENLRSALIAHILENFVGAETSIAQSALLLRTRSNLETWIEIRLKIQELTDVLVSANGDRQRDFIRDILKEVAISHASSQIARENRTQSSKENGNYYNPNFNAGWTSISFLCVIGITPNLFEEMDTEVQTIINHEISTLLSATNAYDLIKDAIQQAIDYGLLSDGVDVSFVIDQLRVKYKPRNE